MSIPEKENVSGKSNHHTVASPKEKLDGKAQKQECNGSLDATVSASFLWEIIGFVYLVDHWLEFSLVSFSLSSSLSVGPFSPFCVVGVSTAGTSGQVTKHNAELIEAYEGGCPKTEKVLIEDITMSESPIFVASMNSLQATNINDSLLVINAIKTINKEMTTGINEGIQVVEEGICTHTVLNNLNGPEKGFSPPIFENRKTVVIQEVSNTQAVRSKSPHDFGNPNSEDPCPCPP
ncbi:hypothetical protein QYF36_022090 [Acer negundo]|nr:hypothetical protein QYF36_022090 [Acer negundo]